MRFKKIALLLISAFILSNCAGFAVENPQKAAMPNYAPSAQGIQNITKEDVNSIQPSDLQALRSQLQHSRKDFKAFGDEKPIVMDEKFSAFAEKTRTNLFLRDIDVASVLRILAKDGGKNIVIDDSVKGTINADLRNISINEAMQTILTSQELEYRVEGNTIFVASRPAMARKGLNRKYIKAFKLNNANSVDVAKILEASIFNKGYVLGGSSSDSSSSSSGTAMQAVAGQPQPGTPASTQNPTAASPVATTTGQSTIASSKTIRGRIDTLDPGSNFNDAGKLASEIKIQNRIPAIGSIDVSNNDGGAIVIPDTRTNSVLIAGLQQDILLAEQAIQYLDKPLPQVSIEVSLIEVSKEDKNDLGLSTSGVNGRFSGGYNSVTDAVENVGLATAADNTGIMFSTVKSLHNNIAVRLNTLMQTNKAKLLANPTVISLDGSESLIKITDQIVSKMTVTTEAMTNTVMYTPELADIGIVLNILPKVADDGYITMRVRPSITTLKEKVDVGKPGDGGYANLISTREVILQDARVKSGETLLIAGLLKDSDIEQISKLPFAGDLPILGQLFRNKTLDHSKSELFILITPRIIDDIAYN